MKGCRKTKQIHGFSFNRESELLTLQRELQAGTYQPGALHFFTVHDPKKRTIAVAPFRDRVVHHAVVNILEPVFEKRFIYHSYASRKNKGTHKAVEQAQRYARQRSFYVKIDIEQYFASIDHDILFKAVKSKIYDKRVLSLVHRIIHWNPFAGTGLPIGNLTSQFFANIYLDLLDHFVKDELGIKGYVRYMDDCVIFGWSPRQLEKRFQIVRAFLSDQLKLYVNKKALRFGSSKAGLSFLGRVIYPGCIRIRSDNKKRSIKRAKKRFRQWKGGYIDDHRLTSCLESINAHLRHSSQVPLPELSGCLHQLTAAPTA